MTDPLLRPAITRISRRGLLKLAGSVGLGTASASLLAACQRAVPEPTAVPDRPAATPTSAAGVPVAQPAGQKSTITWSFWGEPSELPPNDEVIKAFNEQHPNIEIKKFHEPWTSYFDKVQTMFAAGTAPDVLFLTNVPSYAARGALEPLDDLVRGSSYDIQDFVPAELRLFEHQGRLYGFPRDNDTKVLYYNKDSFDEAKLPYPDETWDWNALREAATRLTRREGERILQYGAAIEGSEWPAFVWQNGAEVYDDAFRPTRCLLDQPDQAEAITFLADLMNKDRTIPNATSLTQAGGVTNMFAGGLAAIVISNAPRLLTFARSPFKWDVAVLPKQKRHANYVGGAGYVMSAQSREKEAAWTFMQFLNGMEAQKIFAKGGGVVPARLSAQKSDVFLQGGPPGVNMDVFVTATSHGHLNVAATIGPWQDEMGRTVNKDLDVIWSGQAEPSTHLKVVASSATGRLKRLVQ